MNARLRHLLFAGLLFSFLVSSWGPPPGALAQGRSARASKSKAVNHRAKAAKKFSSSQTRATSSRQTKTSLLAAKKGNAPWQKRRAQQSGDTGLKDHASRHSELSPKQYLQLGRKNVSRGRMLKGGGRHADARYYIRKLNAGDFSMTITNKRGQILSIDTWKSKSTPLTRESIERGLRSSGVTTPKNFWKKL